MKEWGEGGNVCILKSCGFVSHFSLLFFLLFIMFFLDYLIISIHVLVGGCLHLNFSFIVPPPLSYPSLVV